MAKVLIGNLRGPEGPQGKQGEQGDEGDRGVRGSRWVSGKAITGISTIPTVFATGIIDAMTNDHYFNTDNGNIYRCYEGGDEQTATWVFIGNIWGTIPAVEDSLESKSAKNALSANKGRELKESITEIEGDVEELQNDASYYNTITEDEDEEKEKHLLYTLSKIYEGARRLIYPITHAKAVWWSKISGITLYDKIKANDNAFTNLKQTVDGMPNIYTGTEEPDSSVGENGDIYIQIVVEE